ncbi:MAG: phosphohydrolase, partial [Eubacterium sp.]|nr:phosphohydrolase [Eubacterium sp.]
RTGRFFNHNVQSARVLDKLFQRNISLQVLDGVLCHNGEFEQKEYRPNKGKTFEDLDKEIESCYTDGPSAIKSLVPTTLEGCVVRISDMIAYIGKDRQDALTAKIIDNDTEFSSESIGDKNAEIINNLSVDIIENSYGKDYILLSEAAYNDLKTAKRENYEMIYLSEDTQKEYDSIIGPMFEKLYDRLYEDVVSGDENSIIYRHHINFINNNNHDRGAKDYREEDKHQIVVDFISSMTDDYFIALYNELFPEDKADIKFKTYF